MKNKLSICRRLIKVIPITMISLVTLYGMSGLPAYAGVYPNLDEEYCMADAYLLEPGNKLAQDALNCTANDVEITQVTPVNASEECNLGETFTFPANVTVRTNANERWDTTFYLPLTELSPQVVHGVDKLDCSVILPIPGDSGETADVQLDGDACGDITKALGPDEYVLENVSITMLCADADEDNRADFTYCAAWDNIERDNCELDGDYPGQVPNNKSKCNCDTFNIDVFITPDAPEITKSLVGVDTRTEPGGVFTFDVYFQNTNTNTSIFLTSLTDQIDIVDPLDDPAIYDVSVDLWGPIVAAGSSDGIYLTASNCAAALVDSEIEILPSAVFSCQFEVTIVATDLPDLEPIYLPPLDFPLAVTPIPAFYDDVIQLSLVDKNDDPVTNGETCPADLAGTVGTFCSNKLQVNVTNLPPDIRVEKTANKSSVLEPGENVEFTITVYNDSATYDSPVDIIYLNDSIYGDLAALGNCNTITSIAFGGQNSCKFTAFVGGDQGDSFTNIVTAIGQDNENDTDIATASHTVLVNNVPSNISLTKTPDVSSVLETGDDPSIFRDVDFTFVFSVNAAGVDDVTFDGLTDTVFGNILADCIVDKLDGNPTGPFALNGYTLSPNHNASCTMTKQLQGYDDDQHNNTATITGDDEDGQYVQAMASATVDFDPVAPAADMKFATSLLVVLEMHNAGIENVNLSDISLKGDTTVNDTGPSAYTIRNTIGGYHNGVFYPSCNIGEPIGYNGSGTDIYSCAFIIELKPGIENAVDINFLATLANGVKATFTNVDGESTSNSVGIQVITDEPVPTP